MRASGEGIRSRRNLACKGPEASTCLGTSKSNEEKWGFKVAVQGAWSALPMRDIWCAGQISKDSLSESLEIDQGLTTQKHLFTTEAQ